LVTSFLGSLLASFGEDLGFVGLVVPLGGLPFLVGALLRVGLAPEAHVGRPVDPNATFLAFSFALFLAETCLAVLFFVETVLLAFGLFPAPATVLLVPAMPRVWVERLAAKKARATRSQSGRLLQAQ